MKWYLGQSWYARRARRKTTRLASRALASAQFAGTTMYHAKSLRPDTFHRRRDMSEGAIEPTAVYPPSGAGRRFYQTYNTRYVSTPPPPSSPPPGGPGFNYSQGFLYRNLQRTPGGPQPVQVPKYVPRFLGSRAVIMLAWVLAMMMVSLDEWHTHHVLPRPARLWYTTITYALLALVSTIDPLVPICTLIAIGLTISVGYEYYTGSGDFGNYGATEASTPAQGNTPAFNAGQAGAAEAKATGTAF